MPGIVGIEGTRKIVGSCARVLVLAASESECESMAAQLEKVGVKGCVSRADLLSVLIPAIDTVLHGGTWFQGTKAMRASA